MNPGKKVKKINDQKQPDRPLKKIARIYPPTVDGVENPSVLNADPSPPPPGSAVFSATKAGVQRRKAHRHHHEPRRDDPGNQHARPIPRHDLVLPRPPPGKNATRKPKQIKKNPARPERDRILILLIPKFPPE